MKPVVKWLIIIVVIGIIILLFRAKLVAPASLLSGLLALAALAERIIRIRMLRQQGQASNAPGQKQAGRMDVAEAKEILELSGEVTETQVKQAYKCLMLRNHPDQGGSKYFSAQLNEAKAVLLAALKQAPQGRV